MTQLERVLILIVILLAIMVAFADAARLLETKQIGWHVAQVAAEQQRMAEVLSQLAADIQRLEIMILFPNG